MIAKIIHAIGQADANGLADHTEEGVLSGFSGSKIIGALQRLAQLFAQDNEACYVEVGVFQGLTLLSVAHAAPSLTCYGIDNFAFLDPKGENFGILNSRTQRLGLRNVVPINLDYEDALETLGEKIGDKKVAVYFVDGPHDYRSQLMCLELALPYLHQDATIIVDDSNYQHVRQANRDFLVTHPEYKLVFEAYTKCHPANMAKISLQQARDGWWNGINVIARDKSGELPPMFPDTERSRALFENEHVIQSLTIARHAPYILSMVQSVYWRFRSFARIFNLFENRNVAGNKLYKSMNTYSSDLPSERFNKLQTGRR